MEFPDVDARANGKLPAADRQPHRLHEVAEMGIEYPAVIAQDNELARLISGHQERRVGLFENLTSRMDIVRAPVPLQ